MKKVLDLLEQHVQWLAIALGGAFMIFMAWSYMISAPVTTVIGKDTRDPSDIQKYIFENPIANIESQMVGKGSPTDNHPLPTLGWLTTFKGDMDFGDKKPMPMSRPWVESPMIGLLLGSDQTIVENNVKPIESLPAVPPAVMGGWTAGSSSVAPPGQNLQPTDKTWVAIAFAIPNKEQAAAFAAVKLPKSLYQVAVCEVQLYRQQQKQDGTWMEQSTLVARLPFPQLQAVPGADAGEAAQQSFLKWAADSQKPILQPEFYDVLGGDPFVIPGMLPVKEDAQPVVVVGLPNFDPNKWDYTAEEQKQMTPEQRKLFNDAKARHEKEEREARKGQHRGGGTAGKGGAGRTGGAHSGDDADRPADVPPDSVPNPFAPDATSHSSALIPMLAYVQTPPAPDAPPAPATGPDGQPTTQPANPHPCPTGKYDPSVAPEQWHGWAFDETADPGKVYRYRIVYSIQNPVFRHPERSNAEMAKQIMIRSDEASTKWTDGIKIPSRTSFYIAKSMTLTEKSAVSVTFDVFAWQNGAKRRHEFVITPGDMIGSPVDGVDFATGSTLVDVVADRRTSKVAALIADAAGNITRRDFDTDKTSKDYDADKAAAQNGGATSSSGSSGGNGSTMAVGK